MPGHRRNLAEEQKLHRARKIKPKAELETSMDINIVYAYINTFMNIYIYIFMSIYIYKISYIHSIWSYVCMCVYIIIYIYIIKYIKLYYTYYINNII